MNDSNTIREVLAALVRQIAKTDPVDHMGHTLRVNSAYIAALEALATTQIEANTPAKPVATEPPGRTDQEIVDQTELLSVWLLDWRHGHEPEGDSPMRHSKHPFAKQCWQAACHIQEMLTDTDPLNAIAELDDI